MKPMYARPSYLTCMLSAILITSNCGCSSSAKPATAVETKSQFAAIVGDLQKAGVPVHQLDDNGKVAVTLAAGRVVSLAFNDGENVFWTNPKLGDTALVKNTPDKLVGGIGGDRLWFSPELDYHWTGEPNWDTFANYKVPEASDPGAYTFEKSDPKSIVLHGTGELPVIGADRRVGYDVQRTIHLTNPPIRKDSSLLENVDYVGIETTHHLKLSEATRHGRLDLWHLMQIPAGSVLIVPRKPLENKEQAKPLSYGLPGGWVEKSDHIVWKYGGEAKAKFGLSVSGLTGRTGILRRLDSGKWCLIVRQFTLAKPGDYIDHPFSVARDDQAFQAWDGYGFGEMEFHSPALDADKGIRECEESDQIWAFRGSATAIENIAARLLNVKVSYIVGH